MRNTSISLAIFFIFSVFILSCTSPTSSEKASITGRIFYADSENPAGGAKVFLGSTFCYSNLFHFYDSTYTNSLGYFTFNNVENSCYYLFACKYSDSYESDVSYISPLSDRFSYDGENTYYKKLFIYPVFEEGEITGNVMLYESQIQEDSAKVMLKRLEDKKYVNVDSVFSNNDGNYSFENVRTGTYCIFATKIDTSMGYLIYDNRNNLYNDGKEIYTVDTLLLWNWPAVEKPAIYIYPEEDSQFQVQLILKNGTRITKSIPEYNSGWNVFIEKYGRIDSKYDYLFYEASIAKIPNVSFCWCISQKNLKIKLNDLLLKIGLNKQETNEFLDYWLKRLQVYKYYKIFPVVNQQLDELVELKITPPPKTIFRIWLFFHGSDNLEELPSPQINDFIREGTTVIEWGGVMLNYEL